MDEVAQAKLYVFPDKKPKGIWFTDVDGGLQEADIYTHEDIEGRKPLKTCFL